MFNKIFGTDKKIAAIKYQKVLHDMFNTQDGKEALAWLVKEHMLDSRVNSKLSHEECAYENGKKYFIQVFLGIVDFDIVKFIKESNGHN